MNVAIAAPIRKYLAALRKAAFHAERFLGAGDAIASISFDGTFELGVCPQ